jgi:hypothetical protein
MVKRVKRVEKGIESLKEQIEEHFKKIDRDIQEKNVDRGRYHLKEIDKSLLKALEIKIRILGITNDTSILTYKERLENLRKILGLDNSE